MLFGHNSDLAIQAALYLALQPPGKLCPVREIAEATGLPGPYLAKIMRRLIRAGLVRGFRGPGGGLVLGRAPDTITVWALVQATDGSTELDRCVLGLGACSGENPCPLHLRWFPLRAEMQRLLEETTLASLVEVLRDAAKSPSGSRLLGDAGSSGDLFRARKKEAQAFQAVSREQ
jgi:Rrf2 family protein